MALGTIVLSGAADLGSNGGSTNSYTAAYTVGTGENRLLVVGVVGDLPSGFDDITGVTYAGVSMTLAAKSTNSNQNRNIYYFYLLNPVSGTNNVVISSTNSHFLIAGAADYSGVSQTGQPDAVATTVSGSAVTSFTANITTVSANAGTIAFSGGFTGNATTVQPGAKTAILTADVTIKGTWGLFSGGGQGLTPGTVAITSSWALGASSPATTFIATIIVSFAPATSSIGLIAHTGKGSSAGAAVTTNAVDTTGATLLILALSDEASQTTNISDSAGNSGWTQLTPQVVTGFERTRLYYCPSPITSTTHTFTATPSGGNSFPAIAVAAFSNITLSNPFDQQNGAHNNAGGLPIQPGSITPAVIRELIVTCYGGNGASNPEDGSTLAVTAGFLITDIVPSVGGGCYNVVLAFLLENTAPLTVNPAWQQPAPGTAGYNLALIASFEPQSLGTPQIFIQDCDDYMFRRELRLL